MLISECTPRAKKTNKTAYNINNKQLTTQYIIQTQQSLIATKHFLYTKQTFNEHCNKTPPTTNITETTICIIYKNMVSYG